MNVIQKNEEKLTTSGMNFEELKLIKVENKSKDEEKQIIAKVTSEIDEEIKSFDSETQKELNELIEATDKKINIAAASLSSTPTTKDKVIVGSVTYSIIRVETNQLANDKLIFVCYLRT